MDSYQTLIDKIVANFKEALTELNFSKGELEEIYKGGHILSRESGRVLRNLSLVDKRFGSPIREFQISVPLGLDVFNYVDGVCQGISNGNMKETLCFEKEISSKNFNNSTDKLCPGSIYNVKVIPVLSSVPIEDCLAFLSKHKGLLMNVQGLMFVHEMAKDKLPKNKWIVSLDKADTLWKDKKSGGFRMVNLHVHNDGTYFFNLGYFNHILSDEYCILLIEKVKKRSL